MSSNWRLVTDRLNIKLNDKLFQLCPRIVEYGSIDTLALVFVILTTHGYRNVTELEFKSSSRKFEIGIFGSDDPVEVLSLLRKKYPNVTILVRSYAKKKGK
jgi:hypothetical protein